jgi:acetate kinase
VAVQPQPDQMMSISSDSAKLPAYVVGVDEETAIARETVACLKMLNAEC